MVFTGISRKHYYLYHCLYAHVDKKQFNNKDLDLISIWSRQAVPNTVQQTLIDLSEKVYFKITDSTRSVENVTQWCKREECWNSVKNISYILPDSIENFDSK